MKPGTSWIRPVVRALITVLPCLVLAGDAAAQPDRGPGQDIPPWKRPLSGEAAARVAQLGQEIAQLRRAGRFAEALAPAHKVAEVRTRLQGADRAAHALRLKRAARPKGPVPLTVGAGIVAADGCRAPATSRPASRRATACRDPANAIPRGVMPLGWLDPSGRPHGRADPWRPSLPVD